MKSTQNVLARTDCATDIPSRKRNRKPAVSLSLPKVPIGPSPLSYRLSLCLTLAELDGDQLQEAPELVGAIALGVGEEHPVPIIKGDADVLLLGALLVHLCSTRRGAPVTGFGYV